MVVDMTGLTSPAKGKSTMSDPHYGNGGNFIGANVVNVRETHELCISIRRSVGLF